MALVYSKKITHVTYPSPQFKRDAQLFNSVRNNSHILWYNPKCHSPTQAHSA